jgi:DNA-binding transcriptional MerR regulator
MTKDQPSARNWRTSNTGNSGASADDSLSIAPPETPTEERFLRIDEVARRTKLTKRTLRYYEELGLLDPAQRSEGNYRLYSESDIHILEHIKAMRDLLGLGLKEIREMVTAELERERIRAQWRADPDLHPDLTWRLHALDEVERVAHVELGLLDEKLAGLEQMRHTLLDRLEKYQRLRGEIRAQLDAAQRPAKDAARQADGITH